MDFEFEQNQYSHKYIGVRDEEISARAQILTKGQVTPTLELDEGEMTVSLLQGDDRIDAVVKGPDLFVKELIRTTYYEDPQSEKNSSKSAKAAKKEILEFKPASS